MSGGGTRLRRSSLRQQIAEALRDEILTGRLAAGRHFTVKEIAEVYGVSATPVREALVDLAAQGLLDIEHHRGFQVRALSLDDYRDLVEARILVTDGIFPHIIERARRDGPIRPETALASVRRRAEAAASAVRSGSLDVLIGCDLRFWRELVGLAGNPHVSDFLDRLRVRTWIFGAPHLRRMPDPSGVCWTDHVPLAEAVRDGDALRARSLLDAYDEHALTLTERLAEPAPRPRGDHDRAEP